MPNFEVIGIALGGLATIITALVMIRNQTISAQATMAKSQDSIAMAQKQWADAQALWSQTIRNWTDPLEEEIRELRAQIREQDQRIDRQAKRLIEFQIGIQRLIEQLTKLDIMPVWMPGDNSDAD